MRKEIYITSNIQMALLLIKCSELNILVHSHTSKKKKKYKHMGVVASKTVLRKSIAVVK